MPIDPVINDPFGIEEGGLHLVEASAGTGKTTLLSVLFLKAIIVWNHPVDKIAVITFTRAATQELLKRIRKELLDLRSYLSRRGASTGSEVFPQPIPPLLDLLENVSPEEASSRIERAILDFDRVVIRTIHSFYQGLLSEIMHLAGITEEREVVTRTEPYVFEATARFLRDDLERIHPALRRYWFQKGITTLAFYNGDFLENPKPDPSRLTSRVISLAQGGWPVSDPELLSGPGIDLLEEAFAQVFEKKQIVNELSVEDHSSERTKLLSDADFPFNILCAKSDQSLKIKGALDAQKTQNPVLKKALVELSASMDFLRERWEEASKAFVRRMMDHVGKILEENKKAAQIRFHDDALLLLLGILEKEEKENPDSPDSKLILAAIRSKFKVFLVDEFQDTDPSQISLLLKIGKNDSGDSLLPTPSMVFVGDPKQSIYHFRGADLQSYIRFREKMGGACIRSFVLVSTILFPPFSPEFSLFQSSISLFESTCSGSRGLLCFISKQLSGGLRKADSPHADSGQGVFTPKGRVPSGGRRHTPKSGGRSRCQIHSSGNSPYPLPGVKLQDGRKTCFALGNCRSGPENKGSA